MGLIIGYVSNIDQFLVLLKKYFVSEHLYCGSGWDYYNRGIRPTNQVHEFLIKKVRSTAADNL